MVVIAWLGMFLFFLGLGHLHRQDGADTTAIARLLATLLPPFLIMYAYTALPLALIQLSPNPSSMEIRIAPSQNNTAATGTVFVRFKDTPLGGNGLLNNILFQLSLIPVILFFAFTPAIAYSVGARLTLTATLPWWLKALWHWETLKYKDADLELLAARLVLLEEEVRQLKKTRIDGLEELVAIQPPKKRG